MFFGLSGASGTGKTTLGTQVGNALSIPFVKTSITDMAAEAGYKAVGELSLPDRLDLQEKLLTSLEGKLKAATGPTIFDRTPLDLIGYLLAEYNMHSHKVMTPDQLRQIDDYVTRCQKMTDVYFDNVFITGILPEYELAETRPMWNPAYQRHVHTIIVGSLMTMSGSLRYSIFTTSNLNQRVEIMSDFIEDRLNEVEAERKTARHIN